MDILNKKEGSFYSNKILVVSVFLMIVLGIVLLVHGTEGDTPTIKFISPSANNTVTTDTTYLINITFNASFTGNTNVTLDNSSINVTINSIVYNYSNMTCIDVEGEDSMTCNFTTTSLPNGTFNIVANARDNGTATSTVTLSNLTVYTGPPKILNITMSDPSPTKAGNVNFTFVFDRLMNTSLNVSMNISLATAGYVFNATNGSIKALHFDDAYTQNGPELTSTLIINVTLPLDRGNSTDGKAYVNISGAKDIASNSMEQNDTYTFVLDTVAPEVNLLTTNYINQSDLLLVFNFTDNLSTTAHCQLYLNSTLNNTNTSADNGTAINISMVRTENSELNWTIWCNDTANNMGYATVNRTVSFDNVAPVLASTAVFPQAGYYINSTGSTLANITATDALTGIKTTSTDSWITAYIGNSRILANYTVDEGIKTLNVSGTLLSLRLIANLSKLGIGLPENEPIVYEIYARDHAGNLANLSTTFYIDDTPPTVGAASLDASSYTQGDNLTISVQVNDTYAGVNRTNMTVFYINVTNVTGGSNIGAVDMVCPPAVAASVSCNFTYNTSLIPLGSYRVNGTIVAYDNAKVSSELQANNGNGTFALDFVVTDAGTPILSYITTNLTRVVKDVLAVVEINLTVNDSSGVDAIWATYGDNSSTVETHMFHEDGGVTDTSISILGGNCTILANSSGGTVRNNTLNITLHANDTTGSSTTLIISVIVENDPINVSSFTVSTKPYENGTIKINTTVFSWYGSPAVEFNITNTSVTDNGLSVTADCSLLDRAEKLYSCVNTTALTTNTETSTHSTIPLIAGNTSTVSVTNASQGSNSNDATLPSGISATVYANQTIHPIIGANLTVTFSDSGNFTTGINSLTVSSAVQDVVITGAELNGTVITLSSVNATAITNFTVDALPANHSFSNGTNFSYVQASLTTAVGTLLTAMVIQPQVNNASTFGDNLHTIAFNCTALNVLCNSSTRVYRAPFNITTNTTVSNTWTALAAPTLTNSSSGDVILTVTTSTFSIFALIIPPTAAADEDDDEEAASSSGGGGGGGAISSVTTAAASKTQVWTKLNKGSVALMNILNDQIAISKVKFTVQGPLDKPEMMVASLKEKPAEVSSASVAVYQYLEITTENIASTDIGDAYIEFSVDKSWLTTNGVSRADVVLLRYADGRWNELPTSFVREDGGVHYRATTGGFSYFAIGAKEGAEVTPAEEAAEEGITEPTGEAVTEPTGEEAKPMGMTTVLIIIAAIVVILIIIYSATKKKK